MWDALEHAVLWRLLDIDTADKPAEIENTCETNDFLNKTP